MKILKKKYIRLFAIWFLGMTTMSFARSYLVETKVLTEQFKVNQESHLKVKNDCGPIEFRNTDEAEARVEATLLVEGKTKEEIDKVMEQFSISVNVYGNVIDVEAGINLKSWEQYNVLFYHKNTMTFNDGKTAEDIKETDVSLVVYLPTIKELSINNKYDDVTFGTLNCHVNASLMSSDFTGGDINGNVDVDLKYGNLKVGNIQNGNIHLFDSDVIFENGQELEINSKYSDIKFGDIKKLEQYSFDDELEFGTVKGPMKMNAKYSNIRLQDLENADFDLFDSDIVAGEGSNVVIDSKYSSLKFKDLESIEVESFEDDFTFGVTQQVNIKNSKYSSYTILEVNKELIVHSSFSDEIVVSIVGEHLETFELDSKYTDLTFPIPSSVAYYLDAHLRYCNFDLPESSNEKTTSTQGESMKLAYEVNGPKENSLKVKIQAYDGDIDIKK